MQETNLVIQPACVETSNSHRFNYSVIFVLSHVASSKFSPEFRTSLVKLVTSLNHHIRKAERSKLRFAITNNLVAVSFAHNLV